VLKTWYCSAMCFFRFFCRLSTINHVGLTGIIRNALAEGHIQLRDRQKTDAGPTALLRLSTPAFQHPRLGPRIPPASQSEDADTVGTSPPRARPVDYSTIGARRATVKYRVLWDAGHLLAFVSAEDRRRRVAPAVSCSREKRTALETFRSIRPQNQCTHCGLNSDYS